MEERHGVTSLDGFEECSNLGLSVLRSVRMKFYESYYFFRLSCLLTRKLGKEAAPRGCDPLGIPGGGAFALLRRECFPTVTIF
jgi:hypothetical protein